MPVAPGRSILSDPVHTHILDTCVVSELVRKRPDQRGKQIPAIDGLIAATALVAGAIVVTRNELHFQRSGVEVINPWTQRS